MLGISLGAYIVYANPSSTFYISSGIYPHGIWTLDKDGTEFIAKNAYGFSPSWSGSTNFSYVFQQTINTLASNGGSIFIKGHGQPDLYNYRVKKKVSIPANTHGLEIWGEGYSTRLLLHDNVDETLLEIGENCTRITIRDMRLSGNYAHNTMGHGINIKNGTITVLLENLHIHEFAYMGICHLQSSIANIVIRRCTVTNTGQNPVYIKNAHSNSLIEDSLIGNAVEAGYSYNPYPLIHLDQCKSVDIQTTGVFGGKYGIKLSSCRNIKLSMIYPHVNQNYGIWFDSCTESILTDTIVYSCGQNTTITYSAGIYILDSSNITINTCKSLNNLGWFTSPFTDNSQRYGIREGGTSNFNMILGSSARGNINIDIETSGTNTKVNHSWNGTTWIS